MEKLELKHLAPYLPYGLRAINLHGKEVEIIGLSNGNDSVSNHLWVFRENDKTGRHFQGYLYECKPLLHPLERLTMPILEDGETPIDRLMPNNSFWVNDVFDDGKCLNLFNGTTTFTISKSDGTISEYIPYKFIEKLFEYHMDVFRLIEKGLAEPIEL